MGPRAKQAMLVAIYGYSSFRPTRRGTIAMSSIEPKEKIRVYLVEYHPVLREMMARELAKEPDIIVVGQATTSVEAEPNGGAEQLDALTPRERQVIQLLAVGNSTREAAARLNITPKTVERHRVRIYQKLACKSAVELTRIAVRTGMIEA
jgi:DNA-binding NarL/FixJ family response regulator